MVLSKLTCLLTADFMNLCYHIFEFVMVEGLVIGKATRFDLWYGSRFSSRFGSILVSLRVSVRFSIRFGSRLDSVFDSDRFQ